VWLSLIMQIDIGTVLNKFDDTVDELNLQVKEYGLRFITADGRLRTIRARKNVKAPKQQLREPLQSKGRVMFNLKRNGTILLEDLDIHEPRAVKVAMITHFKDFKSTSWLPVFH
jgi:hypothetical protein